MLRLGWFSTGRGPGSLGLLKVVQESILAGVFDARIEFVCSNREEGEAKGSDNFFGQVLDYGLPLVTLSSRALRRIHEGDHRTFRALYHRELMSRIQDYKVDVCVLAGYMLIASEEICNEYTLLNLHPALPGGPAGTWQEVIWRLIETRATETGAMIHLATKEVDRGPVVTYFTLPLRSKQFDSLWEQVEGRTIDEIINHPGEKLPLFKAIREEGIKREQLLLAQTIKILAMGKVTISGRKVLSGEGNPIAGYCLNEPIESALSRYPVS
jgi:phosphoribosylglycinamide formyltransferase-1